jgi:hypothetical protein
MRPALFDGIVVSCVPTSEQFSPTSLVISCQKDKRFQQAAKQST